MDRVYTDRAYIYNIYHIPVSGCETSTVFVLSCSNELVTWGGFMALLPSGPCQNHIHPKKHRAFMKGLFHEHSPLGKALSKSTIYFCWGWNFDGSDSHETFFHDYMAGTRRDDTDISPAAGPPLREASLAGKFRWQGLLGAPWRKLSGNLYAWPHGFQNLSKGNSPPSIEAIQSIQPILKIQTHKNIRFVQSLPVKLASEAGIFFNCPLLFFWKSNPCLNVW